MVHLAKEIIEVTANDPRRGMGRYLSLTGSMREAEIRRERSPPSKKKGCPKNNQEKGELTTRTPPYRNPKAGKHNKGNHYFPDASWGDGKREFKEKRRKKKEHNFLMRVGKFSEGGED